MLHKTNGGDHKIHELLQNTTGNTMKDETSQWYLPLRGDENILLGRKSALRRIPINITPKQAFFIDGIRHAAEILDIAYGRLRTGLTTVATNSPQPEDLPHVGAALFLDAWAVVDAIDKFRQLYLAFPGMTRPDATGKNTSAREALQTFRDLRNIGDHLAAKADWVVAKDGGAALGELTWLTGAQLLPSVVVWDCILRPGTMRSRPTLSTSPIESTLDWPTDCICLKIGNHQGNISKIRIHIAALIRHLEFQLESIFSRPEHNDTPIINDFFGKRPLQPKHPIIVNDH